MIPRGKPRGESNLFHARDLPGPAIVLLHTHYSVTGNIIYRIVPVKFIYVC